MDSHSHRSLRRALLERGISRRFIPQTRLALFASYITGIAVVFGVVAQVLRSAGSDADTITFVEWWSTATRIIAGMLLFALLLRWVRQRFLWSLRRRLFVTYFFIGVIPVLLMVIMALGAGFLVGNQYAASLASADVRAELDSLRVASNMLVAEASSADEPGLAANSPVVHAFRAQFPKSEIALWQGTSSKPAFATPGATFSRPEWAEKDAARTDREVIANDHGKLSLRVLRRLDVAGTPALLVTSEPIDKPLLDRIAKNTGVVRFSDSGRVDFTAKDNGRFDYKVDTAEPSAQSQTDNRPTHERRQRVTLTPVEGGALKPTAYSWDTERDFGSVLGVVDWETGDTGAALLNVRTRTSVLYGRLFSSLTGLGTIIAGILLGSAIAFAIIELVALALGLGLSRTITKSISNLYRATQTIKRGDFSHRIHIEGRDQLAELQRSFNTMTEDIERLIVEQKEKERLQSELAIAQEVQDQLFPHDPKGVPTLEVHGICKPARTVSGDYYDFLPFGEGKLGIAVGDISGKGISAALMMATVHSAVRAYERLGRAALPAFTQAAAVAGGESAALLAHATQSPASALALLNRHLYETTPMEKYATLFLGIYDEPRRTMTYCNGGHLPPYLVGADGSVRKLDGASSLMVGLFEKPKYEDASIELRPGDLFVAFSDGVIEPENDFGEFGTERLLEIVHAHRRASLAHLSAEVIQAVQDWIGAGEQPDDITLVLARAK